jgi:hypothetical protein
MNSNCSHQSSDGAVNPSRIYDLGWFEKRKLKKAALDGDGEAAFRVAQYYLFLSEDRPAQMYWLGVGAKDGNKNAKYYLIDRLIDGSEPENLVEAERLLSEMEMGEHDTESVKRQKDLRDDLEKAKKSKKL